MSMTRGQNTGHKGKFSVNVYRRLEMGCDGCGRAAEQTAGGERPAHTVVRRVRRQRSNLTADGSVTSNGCG